MNHHTVAEEWNSVARRTEVACRDRVGFLSREESRALARQAGDDYRAGDEMAETMERFARGGRDRALAVIRGFAPPPEATDLGAAVLLAEQTLEALPEHRSQYERLGVRYVMDELRRAFRIQSGHPRMAQPGSAGEEALVSQALAVLVAQARSRS
jgi:hypothetical protein